MGLPNDFCRRMQPLLGNDWTAFTAAYDAPLRRGIRANKNKITPDKLLALFPHSLSQTPFCRDSFYVDAPFRAGSDPLHHAGAYYVQEPSATSAVTVLAVEPGEKILDLCAAPGGKSTQIAADLQGTGLLWSNEYVRSRARALEQNLERCGVRQAVVSSCDTQRLCAALPGYFDGVLVDTPCSGEGMFRKEPQALTNWSLDNIQLCAQRQLTILHHAANCVRPGGRLVYSTCTFAPEENEAVIAAFLNRHPEFTLEPIDVPWGSPGFSFDAIRLYSEETTCSADLTRCRRIFPHQGGEGHFIALLRRTEGDAAPIPETLPANDKNQAAAADLYAACFHQPPTGTFFTTGDTVRLLPPILPKLQGLGVLAAGVAVAEVCKNRLEPSHAAFAAATIQDCRRCSQLSLRDPQTAAFLRGEELSCSTENGWTAVAVEGITVGFGKAAGGRLKNRYPKGLRLLRE